MGATAIEFVKGDITRVAVDAIVNAANEWLLGGGGVDGAIHDAAGPELMETCRSVPEVRKGVRCPTGEARVTPAFRLPARFVIHTAGPVYHGREKDVEHLASCHLRCLDLAVEKGCRSISFPALSTGAYGYPLREASVIAVGSVHGWLLKNPAKLDRIVFVLFGDEALEAYRKAHEARQGR